MLTRALPLLLVVLAVGAEFECDMEATDLKDDVDLTGTVAVTLEDAEGESFEYETDLSGPGKTVKQSGTLSQRTE